MARPEAGRLIAMADRPDKKPEIVVFSIVRDSRCEECQAELWKGSFLRMEDERPLRRAPKEVPPKRCHASTSKIASPVFVFLSRGPAAALPSL